MNSRSSGFTLVEVSIYLMIGMSILLLSFVAAQHYKRSQNIFEVREKVNFYRYALQTYHSYHCSDAVFVQPTLQRMINDGILSDGVDNKIPFGTDLSFSINRTVSPATYSISSVINGDESPSDLGPHLGTQSVTGSTVIWSGTITKDYDYDMQSFRRFKRVFSNSGDC